MGESREFDKETRGREASRIEEVRRVESRVRVRIRKVVRNKINLKEEQIRCASGKFLVVRILKAVLAYL